MRQKNFPNKIPVMTWWLPGLDYATRREILEKAYQQFDKGYSSMALWRFYVLEKPIRLYMSHSGFF